MGAEENKLLARITEIKQAFDADPMAFLQSTKDLTKADCALMGRLIQLYCFADLNARRIIDALRHVAFGPKARNASYLQDAQVFPKLREAVGELWECNLKEGLLKAADIVDLHRVHRHNFAHWAARKVDGEDILVLFTKNAREAERRDGSPQEPDELKYAIVPLVGFHEEIRKLDGHGKYLAEQAAHFEKHLDEFSKELALYRSTAKDCRS